MTPEPPSFFVFQMQQLIADGDPVRRETKQTGNIVILGVGIAALVAYSAYQQRRGNDTVSLKKRN